MGEVIDRVMPDFRYEYENGAPEQLVAGLDEVGRGPIAGPVVAACVVFPAGVPMTLQSMIDDSKKLSPIKRFNAYRALSQVGVCYIGVGAASVTEIEALNIGKASHLAMRRAFNRLPFTPHVALVDGKARVNLPCDVKMIVKGDQLSLSIATASIIAKVTRDRLMEKLSRRYDAYGWERNAGYGTATHLAALRSAGICRHHRRGFAPVSAILSQTQCLRA